MALSILLAFSGMVLFSEATVTDLNCTTGGKYDKTAINCVNVQNDNFCLTVFGATPKVNDDTDRPNACWKDATAFNVDVQQGAVAACPLSCGYCCLSSAFTCTNKEFPRISCKSVTDKQCKDPKWRQILAEDCPAVCGFCNEGGCIDAAIECANDKSICRNVETQDFVKTNCKKTCGYCDGSSTTGSTVSGYTGAFGCVDQHNMCAQWQANGFCTSSFYPTTQKRQFCARTCSLC